MPVLYKRGRIWYSDVRVGGRRIRKPLGTDRYEAEKRLADLVHERDGARYGHIARDVSWEAFREKYLAYSSGSKKGSTPDRDLSAIRALEKFDLPKKIASVTPELLERWRAARKAQGKGEATIARDLNAIKAMMRKASAWGYIAKGIDWASVKSPKTTRRRLLFYTVDELRGLLRRCRVEYPDKSSNEVPHDWITICLLGARAGLRRGEILHLGWEDVDFKRQMLAVTPKDCELCQACRSNGRRWEPKDYEQRHIPLAKDLGRHLKGLPRPTEWVLGKRPSLGVISAYFRKIVRKAKLKGSLHTLRHTFASHLAQRGVALYTISKMLGHSSMEMTMRYAHLAPDTYDEAIKKLPSL